MNKSVGFPKSARLLNRQDFQIRPCRRYRTPLFTFVYSTSGRGRLGVSLSKKVLRHAIARNRVKRLLRESFRKCRLELLGCDVHVMGTQELAQCWRTLRAVDVKAEFDALIGQLH